MLGRPESEPSMTVFEAIRARWAQAFDALNDLGFQRTMHHATFGVITVDHVLQTYAWHDKHHMARLHGSGSGRHGA